VEDRSMLKPFFLAALIFPALSHAQSIRGLPSLPTSGIGFHGSVGVGFADFKTHTPASDYRLDRGTYFAASLERGFNILHLYLTFGLNYMSAEGTSNYDYSNLSSSTTYSMDNVSFKAAMYEVSLGLKLKLIDNYWFRPYVEGGGIGSYNQVSYGSQISGLSATGTDYKAKDVIMGSGYYGEGGVEIAFNDKFGVRLAAREAIMQTKKLETLGNRPVRMQNEIYYLSLLFGL
jgi:hypothetical protein